MRVNTSKSMYTFTSVYMVIETLKIILSEFNGKIFVIVRLEPIISAPLILFKLVKFAAAELSFFFLSLYTARPSFEYYRQVYIVHSGLQDESLQVTILKLS